MDDNYNKIDREKRERAARLRLGSANPKCATCGLSDWTCLEAHHIAGKSFDPMIVIECRNCHRRLSDWQKDHPEQFVKTLSPDEKLAHFLLGMADLFELLVEKLREFSRQLLERLTAGAGNRS
jgi:hypothetical protein